ncbi:MAG TPA: hypothetical protein VJI32_01810, partial [Candidatus Nanoarchaeia archaeon]|nr:hypothetical protein [Candidatus Nanoarchaeia archaeon]
MRYLSALVLLLLSLYSVSAATIHGSIYNDHLQLEPDVLVSVDSQPQQKFLAKDGSYIFTLALGKYTLTAQKEDTIVLENINIISDGEYVVDLFLLPGVSEEEDLWNETTQDYFTEESTLPQNWWRYTLISLIVLFALYRIYRARKKYGSLPFFRRKIKAESHKTIEQHQEELAKEPGYLDNALEIIKRHQGRIT